MTKTLCYLIGFMGSGKTWLGSRVAQRLGYSFLDLDALIEQQSGLSIPEIFELSGENGFRQIERSCLHQTFSLSNTIVATGGGAPCFFDNMDAMKQHGATVYLRTDPELLLQRLLPGQQHRPLIAGLNATDLLAFIREKTAQREAYYLQAAYVVEQHSNSDALVDAITALLPSGKV